MADTREILSSIESASQMYHRLVLLVGEQGTGKTNLIKELSESLNITVLNVNLGLSRRLLSIAERRRALEARTALESAINEAIEDVVLLDNCELLFDRTLKLDPLRLLLSLSRNKTIVATWNGTYANNQLSYAEPGHPEYSKVPVSDVIIIVMPTTPPSEN